MPAPRTLRRILVVASLAAATTGSALLAAGPAHAAGTWWVATSGSGSTCTQAAPCATVTTALTRAAAGDTINVLPGTYSDRPLVTKAITIAGTAAGVVFQGSASTTGGWALGVNTNATPGAVVKLSQLTVTAGHFQTGGALPLVNAAVTATDVDVTNSGSVFGGGIYLPSGSLSMIRGSVTGNTATAGAGNQGWGGGIYQAAGTTLSLDGTTVANNTADGNTKSLAVGGGIATFGTTTTNNATFRNNSATASPSTNAFGGAVYANGPSFGATGTAFNSNTATGFGGAITNGKPVTLQGSTFDSNTAAAGGAIDAVAAVTVTGGSMTRNKATSSYGGAIYANATLPLVLDGTDLENNSAPSLGGALAVFGGVTATVRHHAVFKANTAPTGAAISSSGSLTVSDSSFTDNAASFQGGGVFNGSSSATDPQTATFTNTDFTDNSAALAGGAISSSVLATVTVSGGTMSGNSALGGGAVATAGKASLSSTSLVDNTATQLGGGAVFNSGRLQVIDSTLDANTATHASSSTSGWGGAIYTGASDPNITTQLTVTRSTISNNQAYAGSAISSYSTGSGDVNQTSIADSTITANAATSSVGAIMTVRNAVTLARSTLTNNTSVGGSSAISITTPAAVGVTGSIISANSGSACNVAVTDGGHNLVDSGTATCALGSAQNPQLGALAANGGPTKTQLPGPASPALDQITAGTSSSLSDAVSGDAITLCNGTDQRGTARPQGAKCDIGAVEADQTVPVVSGPANLDLTVGSAIDATTYTSTGSPQATLSATGLPAGLSLTDNGDGTASLSGTPTGPGGQLTATIKATNEAGTGSRTVTITVRQAPTLSGPSSDTFTVGQAGGPDVFTQTGGYPAATLSTGSQLPGGVTFTPGSSGDTGNGTIAGTPAPGSGGVYPITVKGSNGTGPDASWPFTLTVDEAPSLTGPAAATYTVGTQGSTDLTVGGYPAPTLSAVGLPAGLSATSHGIGGKPAVGSGGEYDATVTATNGIGSDAQHGIHVTVDEATSIAGPASVRMVTGESSTVSYAAGGFPVASLGLSGSLPAGVTFSDNGNGTGTLSGVPTSASAGSYPVTVTAHNGIGQDATYAVTIQVVPPVAVTTTQLPDASVGSAYTSMVVASGGTPPYAFSLTSGSLPAGLTLSSNGQISGTPTGDAGTSTFTVKVVDATGRSDSRQLSITVAKGATTLVGPPVILSNGLNLGTISATLTGGLPPQGIAGQTITFKANTTVLCTAVTNSSGYASCNPGLLSTLLLPILNTNLVGVYAGNSKWLPSTAQMGLIG